MAIYGASSVGGSHLGRRKKPRPAPLVSPDAIVAGNPYPGGAPSAPAGPGASTSIPGSDVEPAYQSGFSRFVEQRSARPQPQVGDEERGLRPEQPRPRVERDETTLLEKLNRGYEQGYAGDDLEQIKPRHAALLLESVGLPGKTYAKSIIPGESNFRPGVRNPDDSYPSLTQITPSVQSDATQAKFKEIASQFPGGGSNPLVAALQSAYLAGDGDGTSNYVAYDGTPEGHIRGGERRAERILGGDPSDLAGKGRTTPKKLGGDWAGSQRIIRQLIGPYAKTEDWKDKEDRGDPGGTLHDIGTTNAFAADLSTSEALIDRIARKLSKENPNVTPESVDYGTTGLEDGLTYKGYDIEWLPYTHGSGPHNHLAAQWNGGSLPSGTHLGGSVSPGGGMSTGGGGLDSLLGSYGVDGRGAPNAQTARMMRPSAVASPLANRARNPLEQELDEDEEDLMKQLEAAFRPRRRLG